MAFTVLWIVGMINSINFIDGLDGLSTGISLIAAVTLGLISIAATVAQPMVGLLCFALAGSLLGFLRWNFHPASIFIGTSGVMFVGYTLALLAILGSAKVAVALLVLGVPIIDTFWIIVRRLVTGRSPFTPDRGHIHHRLLDLGLSHGQTVLVIYAICLVLAVLSFVLSGTGQVYAFLGLAVAFGLGLFLITRFETADALEPKAYEGRTRRPMGGRRRAPARPEAPGAAGTSSPGAQSRARTANGLWYSLPRGGRSLCSKVSESTRFCSPRSVSRSSWGPSRESWLDGWLTSSSAPCPGSPSAVRWPVSGSVDSL